MSQELLHRTLLDLIFDSGGEAAFSGDPRGFGAAHGLDAPDQEALVRFQPRLRVYKGLVKASILDPIPECFPILKALLEQGGAWQECLEDFFASRSVQSLYYREVNPTFLAWLAESCWGQERWPFLLELAHFEYTELDVLLFPDGSQDALLGNRPGERDFAVFDPAFRNLAYSYRVHDADEEAPEPTLGVTFLVCLRNRQGRFQTQEVDSRTSAFIARAQDGQTLGEAAHAVGLPWSEATELLHDLLERGGLLGFPERPYR